MEDVVSENPIYKWYHYLNYELQDPKTENYPLLTSPFLLMALLALYNFGCLKFGPKFMEKRKPFELRNAIIAFDIFQILINFYLFYMAALGIGWFHHYSIFCGEIDYEDTPLTRNIAHICYIYFLVKISDFLDTVFMVLRKKNRHISFLHMYHHTGMVIMTFINAKYLPGGHHTCLGIYNTFVHTIMYTYYLYAALYPKANLFSFKKLVTKLQMIQFGVFGLHMSSVLMVPDCGYPRWPLVVLIPNNVLMFLLFFDFYRNTYVLKKYQPVEQKEASSIKKE